MSSILITFLTILKGLCQLDSVKASGAAHIILDFNIYDQPLHLKLEEMQGCALSCILHLFLSNITPL